ncbi:zinc ribbon domain-containing protein [Candidatus Omnitrophota bacterium]
MSQARTIKEQIGSLKGLQVIDKEIYALNTEKKDIPGEIESIEKSLESKKTGIKQAEESLKTSQVKLKEREVDLQQKEEQVKKLQLQLYQLKTNKEYATMTAEIEGIKTDNSLVEEEILKLMDEIEMAKKKLIEEKDLFKKEESSSQKQKGLINERVKEIDSRLSELSSQREKIVPDIEINLLARYDRVLENKNGLAIVPIDDGACGGCHMNLPPQVISEAKLKEGIIVCSSCSRILYVDDNVEIN